MDVRKCAIDASQKISMHSIIIEVNESFSVKDVRSSGRKSITSLIRRELTILIGIDSFLSF